MAANLIVEDGSGSNVEANCYISVADADLFFANHIQNASWLAVTDADKKARLLITATRVVDNGVNFKGYKAVLAQPLQWPRILSRDENQYGGAYFQRPDAYLSQYFDSTTIPQPLKEAVCEMARFILDSNNANDDRLADAPGTGISEFEIYEGIKVKMNTKSLRPIIPSFVSDILSQFGDMKGSNWGIARVER